MTFDDIDWLQLSDFFEQWATAFREEEEAAEAWERESVSRMNNDRRRWSIPNV